MDTLETNINNIYSTLKKHYNSSNTSKRILLEQIWVLKKIVDNTYIDGNLLKDITNFYEKLSEEAFIC